MYFKTCQFLLKMISCESLVVISNIELISKDLSSLKRISGTRFPSLLRQYNPEFDTLRNKTIGNNFINLISTAIQVINRNYRFFFSFSLKERILNVINAWFTIQTPRLNNYLLNVRITFRFLLICSPTLHTKSAIASIAESLKIII